MKKTISIISLIIIAGLQAQSIDIAGIDKELAFKLTERVNYKLFDGTTGKGNIEFVEYNGQKYVRLLANDIKNYLITTKFSNYDNLVTWISAFDNVTDAQTLTKIDNAFSHLDNAGLSRINTALEKAGGGIHTEFSELLVKLSEGNTQILAQIAGSTEWGGNKLSKLAEDLASASNDMLREFVENPNLIDAWKKINDLADNAFDQLRKDTDFLKVFDDVTKNDILNKHIFEGDVSYEILDTGQKKWKVGGVHHKTAFDNGTARIKPGTKSTPNAKGYYAAKVEVYHPEFPNNGGFVVKKKTSTFFPDDWSIDKLQAEIAKAIKNKEVPIVYSDGRKLYKGTMTDGTELAIWVNTAGKIISTYPIF